MKKKEKEKGFKTLNIKNWHHVDEGHPYLFTKSQAMWKRAAQVPNSTHHIIINLTHHQYSIFFINQN